MVNTSNICPSVSLSPRASKFNAYVTCHLTVVINMLLGATSCSDASTVSNFSDCCTRKRGNRPRHGDSCRQPRKPFRRSAGRGTATAGNAARAEEVSSRSVRPFRQPHPTFNAVHRSEQCADGWRPKRLIQSIVHCQSKSSFTFARFATSVDIRAQLTNRSLDTSRRTFKRTLSRHLPGSDTFFLLHSDRSSTVATRSTKCRTTQAFDPFRSISDPTSLPKWNLYRLRQCWAIVIRARDAPHIRPWLINCNESKDYSICLCPNVFGHHRTIEAKPCRRSSVHHRTSSRRVCAQFAFAMF